MAKKYSSNFERDYSFYLLNKDIFNFCGTLIPKHSAISNENGKTAKEVFYSIDSQGKNIPCKEPELLNELLLCKGGVNFQIKLWAEGRADGTLPGIEFEEIMNKNKIRSIKTAAKGYAFIGINLIGVLIFWTIPLIFSFIISISKWDYSKGIKGIKLTGLSNYIEMWKDEWFRASLINNIIFTISFVLILVVLSFVVAYVLNEYVVGKKIVQLGLYLPYIVNIVAISAVWLALFSNNGPVISFLKKVGIENPPVFIADLHWALPTIVLICVWQNLGYTVILFLSGMVNIPKDLYEAAAIDGANGLQKIRYVTIPMLSGTTFFIVITSIIFLSEFILYTPGFFTAPLISTYTKSSFKSTSTFSTSLITT